MHVMPSHPYEREHTMTQEKSTSARTNLKALLAEDEDFLREIVREAMQQILEAEMTDTVGAEPGERTEGRLGYRAGHYPRTLVTRVGKLELRVPRGRDGRFSTELFERYQRSEKALVSALAEMYVQGVSTRKVKAITEELCGRELLRFGHKSDQQRPGQEPAGVRDQALGGTLPLPDSRCPLREGA